MWADARLQVVKSHGILVLNLTGNCVLVEVGEYHLLWICGGCVFSWILSSLFVSKGVKLQVTSSVTGFFQFAIYWWIQADSTKMQVDLLCI